MSSENPSECMLPIQDSSNAYVYNLYFYDDDILDVRLNLSDVYSFFETKVSNVLAVSLESNPKGKSPIGFVRFNEIKHTSQVPAVFKINGNKLQAKISN